MIIDFHTHAFPDALAHRAVAQLLSEAGEVRSFLDGKVSSLIASMDANGIEASVLCSIATKPSQFEPIFRWSQQIASDRIIPLASDGKGRRRRPSQRGIACGVQQAIVHFVRERPEL